MPVDRTFTWNGPGSKKMPHRLKAYKVGDRTDFVLDLEKNRGVKSIPAKGYVGEVEKVIQAWKKQEYEWNEIFNVPIPGGCFALRILYIEGEGCLYWLAIHIDDDPWKDKFDFVPGLTPSGIVEEILKKHAPKKSPP
jgi:hypothetical protein